MKTLIYIKIQDFVLQLYFCSPIFCNFCKYYADDSDYIGYSSSNHICISDSSYSCFSYCLACNSSCTACESGFILSNGICLSNSSCKESFPNCKTCNDDLNMCAACNFGYYLSGSICVQCPSNCINCDQLRCTTCIFGYGLSWGSCSPCTEVCSFCFSYCFECTSTRCTRCWTGYYLDSGSCLRCPLICRTCTSTACSTCVSGYYLSGSTCNECKNSCSSCFSLCSTCSNSECLTCDSGYYITSGGSCYSCIYSCNKCYSNCITCNETQCLKCSSGYGLSGTSCIQCNTSCSSCSHNCITCKNSLCIPCDSGYYSSNGYCYQCSKSCSSCFNNCLICTNTECSTCKSGYYLNSRYCSQCSTSCSSCYSNCLICTNLSCLACSSGYYINRGACSKCSSSCTSCFNNCSACTDTGCSTCNAGFYFNGGACFQCNSSCKSCFSNCDACTNTECSTCESGFYIKNGTCSPCLSFCEICFSNCKNCSNTACTVCLAGYYLNQSSCTECPSGYYISNGVCSICPILCLTCNNDKNCTECKLNSIINTSTNICECDDNHYLDEDNCLDYQTINGSFVSNFNEILLKFSRDLQKSKYMKIEDIFLDSKNYFGKNAYIKQNSIKELRIVMGSLWNESLLRPETKLELNSKQLSDFGYYVKFSEKISFDSNSSEIPKFKIQINGPTLLNMDCAYGFFIYNFKSEGSANNKIDHTWSINCENANCETKEKMLNLDDFLLNLIDRNELNISLKARNIFGTEISDSLIVTLNNSENFYAKIDNDGEFSCYFDQTCQIYISRAFSCLSKLTFEWFYENNSKLNQSLSFFTLEKEIYEPKKSPHKFSVIIKNKNTNAETILPVDVFIKCKKPIINLNKAFGYASYLEDYRLNASSSINPNTKSNRNNFKFIWKYSFDSNKVLRQYTNTLKISRLNLNGKHNLKIELSVCIDSGFCSEVSENCNKIYGYVQIVNETVPEVQIFEYFTKLQLTRIPKIKRNIFEAKILGENVENMQMISCLKVMKI